jgi:type I restriction enzyme M protein
MLREMRDAAGDSGEFYTPRPVVRFMVQVSDPRLGETVLDPACGTGGFLVEAYDHIAPQVSTPEQRRACSATPSSARRPSRCPTCWRR